MAQLVLFQNLIHDISGKTFKWEIVPNEADKDLSGQCARKGDT